MPLPSRRLDLHLVPPEPDDRPRALVDRVVHELLDRGMVDDDGRPGPAAHDWVSGGFGRVRIDDPGRVVLYANQQGGFRVVCPSCGENLVPTFMDALSAYRGGAPRRCTCPRCRRELPLEALAFSPPAAFGRISLVTVDAGAGALAPDGAELVSSLLPGWRTIPRRP